MPASGLEKGPPPVALTLDREGRWFHEGLPVLHPGLVSLLNRHLVVDDDGSVEVRVPNRGYVERGVVTVEELPYYVTSVTLGASPSLRLNDETEEPLAPDSVWLVGDDRLYCRVKGGRFPARFLRPAYLTLASRFDECPDGWVLALGATRVVVPVQGGAPPWPPSHEP